jgi:hypothetical protein
LKVSAKAYAGLKLKTTSTTQCEREQEKNPDGKTFRKKGEELRKRLDESTQKKRKSFHI